MNLKQALRLDARARLALVGAGGKTTALFQLARAWQSPVIVTTTTHLGEWQAALADHRVIASRPEDILSITTPLEGVLLVTGPAGSDQRLQGLDAATLDALHLLAERLGLAMLVEADGARQRLLKAPGPHEPVIPPWVDTVVVVAGLAALGQPLDAETVHRPEIFGAISGLAPGDAITVEALARVLASRSGGLKDIPSRARRVALLNHSGPEGSMAAGEYLASLLQSSYDAVLNASLRDERIQQVIEPCAGIILAGGESRRFGQPKMLLPWRGQSLIRRAAEMALRAGLSEVIVVTGAVDAPVRDALDGLAVRVVHNPHWQDGQSTSVRAGVQALPAGTGAALFLLADQPFISAELLRELVQRHQATLAPVVAPWAGGRRANPVLFDRVTFAELAALRGDTGGRAVMDRYPVEFLAWPDAEILFDVDTPDDYQQLLNREEP